MMDKIRVNGNSIAFQDEGRGKPVIFIHGLGGDHREWMLQIPEFSKRFRCVAIDLPGHGKSDIPGRTYTPMDYAADIYSLIDKLSLEKPHIIGLSMGGMITQELALAYPNDIDRIVLVSTSARIPPESTARIMRWIEVYREEGFDAFFELEIKDIFNPTFLKENEWVIPLLKDLWKDRSFETIIWASRGLENWDITNRIHMITNPTLIVHGSGDALVSVEEARLMNMRIPGSRLLIYENAGHALIGEEAERFNRDVIKFLGGIDIS
jgi:proline-specific peptidase